MSELKLKVRNSFDDFILVDPQDWLNVKDVQWYWHKKKEAVTTRKGVTYDEYVGIVGLKNRCNNAFDKRRDHMIPLDHEWRWCNMAQRFLSSPKKGGRR